MWTHLPLLLLLLVLAARPGAGQPRYDAVSYRYRYGSEPGYASRYTYLISEDAGDDRRTRDYDRRYDNGYGGYDSSYTSRRRYDNYPDSTRSYSGGKRDGCTCSYSWCCSEAARNRYYSVVVKGSKDYDSRRGTGREYDTRRGRDYDSTRSWSRDRRYDSRNYRDRDYNSRDLRENDRDRDYDRYYRSRSYDDDRWYRRGGSDSRYDDDGGYRRDGIVGGIGHPVSDFRRSSSYGRNSGDYDREYRVGSTRYRDYDREYGNGYSRYDSDYYSRDDSRDYDRYSYSRRRYD